MSERYTSAPLTSSPPSTPGPQTTTTDPIPKTNSTTSTPGPNPAPISSQVNNPSDGYPRRRPKRQVTLDEEAIEHDTRRPTTDSPRTTGINRQGSRTSGGSNRPMGSRAGSRAGSAFDPNASVLRRMTSGLFTPEKKIGQAPTYLESAKAAIMSTWLNVLLVFIPIGWALYLAKYNGHKESISDTACFITNFIAIIPLAGLLGFATEEAALRCGQTLGGLLNATLGNAVELIVAILALIKCELAVVQSSLIGSILSNILLVLGMCFFAGGVRYAEQTVKSTAAQLNSSLLLIAVIAVLIPSAFHFSITTTDNGEGFSLTNAEEGKDLLAMSHAVAVILLVLYLGYLLFQMWTHAHFYVDEDVSGSSRYPEEMTNNVHNVKEKFGDRLHFRRKKNDEEATVDSNGSPASSVERDREVVSPVNGGSRRVEEHEEEEEEEEVPQMNVITTIVLMVLITVIVGVTAEFLVDSINGLVEAHPSLSQEWVGLILLPIVGNAAEHFTAVSVSVKDKLDLSISVAVGSSIQIALFVIPVIELLAWCIGKPMTLLFDPYESIVLFLSVLIVNQTLSDGRSNWMEGLILMFVYLIIAVSFWYYPGSNTATLVGCGGS